LEESLDIPVVSSTRYSASTSGDVTRLLEAARCGDEAASGRVMELVYEQLREAAGLLMKDERHGHLLQRTALVHEVFLKLSEADMFRRVPDRPQLVRVAVRAMRRLLVDFARRRDARKHGGDKLQLQWHECIGRCEARHVDAVALGESLDALAGVHERASQVMTLRFIGGFSVAEVARQLGVSVSTVEADFRFARAWLRARMFEPVDV